MPRFEPESATARMLAARRHRSKAYGERNELIAVLARLWPAHIMPVAGAMHTLDERKIICVHGPTGHLAWPITDDEARVQFKDVEQLEESHWDRATHYDRTMRLALIDFGPSKKGRKKR